MAEEKTKKAKRSSTTKSIGYIVGIICFTALLILGSIRISTMYQDMQEMKSEIEELNELKESINQKNVILPSGDSQKKEEESAENFSQQQSDPNVYVTQGLDAKDTLDFIENEVSRYREFIEKQQQFLIWLVGIVATGALSLLGFLGFKSKSDIESIIEEEYRTKIDEKVSEITAKEINEKCPGIAEDKINCYIGGQEQIQYLKSNIDREKTSKNKKIVFVGTSSELSKQAKLAYDKIRELGYKVQYQNVDWTTDTEKQSIEENLANLVSENDLLVFQVNESELRSKFSNAEFKAKEKIFSYYKLSEICEEKRVYCILYAEGSSELTFECYKHFYTQMANSGLALLERIFLILNLN